MSLIPLTCHVRLFIQDGWEPWWQPTFQVYRKERPFFYRTWGAAGEGACVKEVLLDLIFFLLFFYSLPAWSDLRIRANMEVSEKCT